MNTNVKYHNVLLVRSGDFVGLYRQTPYYLRLWRCIENKPYGKEPCIPRIDGEWYCNEYHQIPQEYDLRDKEHLRLLASLLGGSYFQVHQRILDARPLKAHP